MKNFAIVLLAVFFTPIIHATTFEPIAKWNRANVRVCWLTPKIFKLNPGIVDDATLDQADAILMNPALSAGFQKKIESLFTVEKTGIHFSGWKKCALDSSLKLIGADAIIAFNRVKDYEGAIEGDSSIGLSLENFMKPRARRLTSSISRPTVAIHLPPQSLVNTQKISYVDQVLLTAVHEFGHLAGLHHEHEVFADAAIFDPHCLSSEFGPYFKSRVEMTRKIYSKEYLDSLKQLSSKKTPYDSNSIMSYCQIFQTMDNGFDFFAEPVKAMPGYYQNGTHVINLKDREIYSLTASPTAASPARVLVHTNVSLSENDNAMLTSVYSKKK